MATLAEASSLTDRELTERCKRNAAEEWLHRSGCLAGLLVGLAAGFSVVTLRGIGAVARPWPFACYLAFVAFFLSALSTWRLFESLSRFRCRHYLRELEARYGCSPLKEHVARARHSLAADETVMILIGHARPLCHTWWVCVRIRGEDGAGSVEARFGPEDGLGTPFDFGAGQCPAGSFATARAALPLEASRRLAGLAEEVRGRKIKSRPTVIDGFPVECAVVRGGTGRGTTISCNLAGVPASHAGRPHVRLVEEVFAAGRALIDRPSGCGATHFQTGDVDVGDL